VTAAASAPEAETTPLDSVPTRITDSIRSGNLGSWPVIFALAIIVLVIVLFTNLGNEFRPSA